MRFVGMEQDAAIASINAYWGDVADIESDALLFSEPAYYYAMCIAHHPEIGDGKINWIHDKDFWPPPKGWEV